MRSRLAFAGIIVLSLTWSACGSDSSGPPASVELDLAATAPTDAKLGTTQTIDVQITSTDYSGPVTVSVVGAPSDWVVAVAPSTTVTVSAGGTVDVDVQVTIPSNGTAAPAGQALEVRAAAGGSGTFTETTTLAVANEFVLPIVGSTGAHWGSYAGTTVTLKEGTMLTFVNNDADVHIVHTDGTIPGLPHQDPTDGLVTGETWGGIVSAGTDDVFCHAHGPMSDAVTIVVVP
jgi:hypothetical protein